MSVLKEQRERQAIGGLAVRRSFLWISLWLVACLSVGNPLACLLHCWYHTSPLAAPVSQSVQLVAAQRHHGADHGSSHGQNRSTDQAPTPVESSAPFSCSLNHQSLSALTIAVLLALIWLVIPLVPGILLTEPGLLLRFVTYPPPSPPPRFALISSSL